MEGTIDGVLTHYGIKGMRWGVRKRSGSDASSETTVKERAARSKAPEPILVKTKAGHPILTSGGRYHAPSDEAKRAAAIKQKASKSGSHALTNAEMRALIDRMNLESQYMKLNPKQKSKADKFVRGVLKTPIPAMVFAGSKQKYGDKSKEVKLGFDFAEMLLKNHPSQKKFLPAPEKKKKDED